MKKQFLLSCMILMGISMTPCYSQMKISEPKYFGSPNSLPEYITVLSKYLSEGNIRGFYKTTQFSSIPIPDIDPDNIHEHINFCLWKTYLIAKAPFFTKKTFITNAKSSDSLSDSQDINSKSFGIGLTIRYMVLINDSKHIKNSDKKRYIQEYLLPYCSLMIYQLKNFKEEKEVVDKEKAKREWDAIDINTPEGVRKMMIRINGDGNIPRYDIDLRNEQALRTFKPATEKSSMSGTNYMIMRGLLKVFPNKYAPIEKFLLDSGFSKEEISTLIDQAVGCFPKTEFLYQGKHQSDNDKNREKK